MGKPILCLDFDGVIHSYTSGWKRADVIPDPPVPGAADFIIMAQHEFDVCIFSSRSHQPGGVEAMKLYIGRMLWDYYDDGDGLDIIQKAAVDEAIQSIKYPLNKPAAMITLDDRAVTFKGIWPSIESLKAFKPWNKI